MRCVECGQDIPRTYQEYSKGNIRLWICSSCNNVADKYVEYESLLIFIDLLVYKPQAYRHILYNRQSLSSEIVVKIGFILTLLDMNMKAYLLEHRENVYVVPHSSYNDAAISALQISQLSLHLFTMAFLENLVYISTLVLLIKSSWISASWGTILAEQGYTKLVGSIFISSFGKLFIMLTVVWEYQANVAYVIDAMVVTSNQLALMLYLKSDFLRVLILILVALTIRTSFQWAAYLLGNPILFYTII